MTHSFPTRRASDLQAPGRSGQQGARGVDVAEAADFRIDQAAGGGVDAYRLLAQQPARQVQVVDGEVLEQPAAGRHESGRRRGRVVVRSEEHTSELQSLMRISYAVFCLKKKN